MGTGTYSYFFGMRMSCLHTAIQNIPQLRRRDIDFLFQSRVDSFSLIRILCTGNATDVKGNYTQYRSTPFVYCIYVELEYLIAARIARYTFASPQSLIVGLV